MKIQTSPNRRTLSNQRDPDNPFAATLNGDILAIGTTAPQAKERAVAALYDVWSHRTDAPVLAIANDGSLFLGYYTGENTAALEHRDIDTANHSLPWRCGYSAMLHRDHWARDFTTSQFASVAEAVKHYTNAWNCQLIEHALAANATPQLGQPS